MRLKNLAPAFVICAGTLALAPQAARAQSYPPGDIHFICGYAAGSGADIIVRFVAEKLRPLVGRSIIVENKPGAIGNIATEYVARAKPDGLTILVTGANSVAGSAHLFKNPTYDAGKSIPDRGDDQPRDHDGRGAQRLALQHRKRNSRRR